MASSQNDTQSYPPLSETSAEFYIERTVFGGMIVAVYLGGVQLVLTIITLHYFISGKRWRNIEWGMVAYTVLLFAGATVYMSGGAKWAENMWIENRNYPGGPVGYSITEYSTPMIVMGNSAYIFNNFLADGLLVYRTWVVYSRSWLVITLPLLIFAGSTVMSVVATFQLAQPNAQFFSHIGLAMSLPYFSLSIALNLISTMMIASKLLLSRRRLVKILGSEHARTYTGVVAMLVESAAIYAIVSVTFIVTYSINNSLFNDLLAVQAQVMCIAPLLIMIRVARGRIYSQEAVTSQISKNSLALNRNVAAVNGRYDTYNMSTLNNGVNTSTSKIIPEV